MARKETKFCARCQRDVPIEDWYRNSARHDGLSGYCRDCQRTADAITARRKRHELLVALGGRCVRCGFDDGRALQIDHRNGGGKAEDPVRTTAAFYAKVLANPDKYQLLCANCNAIKRHEDQEHVGDRDYGRVAPTERKTGPGRHNPEANARRAAGLARWRAENPDADSARARKANATRKVARVE